MRFRILLLAGLSLAMVWGGYQASVIRAGALTPPGEVFAAAGGDEGFFAGADSRPDSDNYRISALSIFSNVALHVKDNYVDPGRIDPKEMLTASLHEIERQVAEVLVEEAGDGRVRVGVPGHSKLVTVRDVESLWEINIKLRDVFRFFEKHLPPQEDMRLVEYAAVNGALSTLDPHSVLLKPEAFAEMKTSTKGEFGGLGIVISIREGRLTIISPLEGTPASRAGLHAMDVITRIGDVSTVSMPIEEAVRLLRGREGSKVTIWVSRKAWSEARKFNLTRERIKIESVTSELLANRIGYVKIKNFQQNTGLDLDEHVGRLEKKNKGKLDGLVLDLRNNPGGLLEQAIRVSDKFLTSGDIVTTVGYGNKLREPKRAQWSSSDLDIPLVVLVNNGSASASEIVAGAMKNLDRALIVGQRTFGKGSVQVLYDFADSSALKLTIAQYLTPGGISIQNIGVQPDIELKPAVVEDGGVRLFYENDGHREKNLKKHLDRKNEDGAASKENAPSERLTYLIEPEPEEDPKKSVAYDSFREDFPISFARKLLSAAGRSKRSATRENARKYLDGIQAEQQKKITSAITGLGVDWAVGNDGSSEVAASLDIKGAAKDGRIAAGSEVELIAKVTNLGQATLYQTRGILESDHASFRGREFLFGKLLAGESKTWSVKVKIPKEADARSDILELELSSATGPLPTTAKLAVLTNYVPHPQFAFSYSFDDSERGDGDGFLERGEGVDLVVHVTNVGAGGADKVNLRLKSAAGEDLFLERGRAEIGEIASGATKSGRLRFRVRENQTPGKDALPLELTIYDTPTGEWLEDQFDVVAAPQNAIKLTKKRGTVTPPTEVLVRAHAGPDAPVLGVAPKDKSLKYNARTKDQLRIDLGKDAGFAWVNESDVKKRGRRSKKDPVLSWVPARRPPRIHIDGQLGGRVVEGDRVILSGTVLGRELRDMYVVVNEEKVFYAPGPKPKAAVESDEWRAPDDEAVKLPFEQSIELKDGLNKILVVARLDEKVVTYRNLFVSKMDLSGAPAVAKAPGKPTKKAAN